MNRDEYVQKLKERIDRLNADVARWEKQAGAAKARQLETYRLRRDEAMYNLKLLENASAAAWKDFSAGVESAWASVQAAYAEAHKHFEKTTKA